MNALIRLRGCAGWSGPSMSHMPEDTFSHAAADIDGKEEDLGIKYMKTLNFSVYKVQRNNKRKKKKKTGLNRDSPRSTYIRLVVANFRYVHVSRVMRKRICGHVRTAKAQISLCVRVVWSRPSLSAIRIIGYYRILWMESKVPNDILRMRRTMWIRTFCACSK